jgi:hypothetical protein
MPQFNTHSDAELKRRSAMALRLKHGKQSQNMALAAAAPKEGSTVKNIPFPKGLAPVPKPIDPAPKPEDSLPRVDVIAMMDTTAEAQAMARW